MIAVAIDGPSGAGKSTLAKQIARRLGFLYVDTGALYRTVALSMLRRGVPTVDSERISATLSDVQVDLRYEDDAQRVFLNGEDVTDAIRAPEVSMAASDVSAVPAVRAFLLETQRDLARRCHVIMDGRDIGTVVLPDADIKLFLTASPEDRARRRYEELRDKGLAVTFENVLSDLIRRDEQDETRAAAPLRPAADAIRVDTTGNTLEQSMEQIYEIIVGEIQARGLS